MDLLPDHLIAAVLAELERLHGEDYARAAYLDYTRGGGWYYVALPICDGDRWAANPFTQPMQRRKLEALLEELHAES